MWEYTCYNVETYRFGKQGRGLVSGRTRVCILYNFSNFPPPRKYATLPLSFYCNQTTFSRRISPQLPCFRARFGWAARSENSIPRVNGLSFIGSIVSHLAFEITVKPKR